MNMDETKLYSWYLGPKADNSDLLERLIPEAMCDCVFWRRNFPAVGPSFFIYFSFPSHATPPGGEYITCVVDAPSVVAKSMAAARWGKES
jgi:hypothetical protein